MAVRIHGQPFAPFMGFIRFRTAGTGSYMGICIFNRGPVTVFVLLGFGFRLYCAADTFPHVIPFADIGQYILMFFSFTGILTKVA